MNYFLDNLTPQNSVLVLVDYLSGLMKSIKTIDLPILENNAIALTKVGALFDLPTIVLGDEDEVFRGKMMPEIAQIRPSGIWIERTAVSAWKEPKFVSTVEQTGRKKLILAGIATDVCVAMLALDALRDDYEIYVVLDASGSDSQLAEEGAISRLTQAGAVMINWVQLGSELLEDWKHPEGVGLRQIYAEHLGATHAVAN